MSFFIVVFALIWIGSVVAWAVLTKAVRSSDVDKIKSRLLDGGKKDGKAKEKGAAPQQLIQTEDQSAGKIFKQILKALDLQDKLQVLLEQAGVRWKPVNIVQASAALFGGAFFAAQVLGLPSIALKLAVGAVAATLPVMHVFRLRKKRLAKFEEQFPESLEFVAFDARRPRLLGISRNDSPRVPRTAGRRVPQDLRRTQPRDATRIGAPQARHQGALARRPLLHLRGAAAKADWRQSRGNPRQTRLSDP
jgi:tight adherence protein B